MRFLFDNNFSPRLVERLNFGDRHICHIRDVYGADAKDIDWLPRLKDDGFVIVTKNLRIRHHPLERQALYDSGATALFVDRQIIQQLAQEQLDWFHARWSDIEAQVAKHPQGTHLRLAITGAVRVWPRPTRKRSGKAEE